VPLVTVLVALLAACGAEEPPAIATAPAPVVASTAVDAGEPSLAGAVRRQALVAADEPAGFKPPPATPWGAPLGAPVEEEQLARFELDSPRFAYGQVFEGEQVMALFRMRNPGEIPLTVHAVQASCGCTVPVLWRQGSEGTRTTYERGTPIAGGEALEIEVSFDSRNRKGRQDKPIYLYANVPGGRIEIELAGEVRPLLVAEPAQLEFGRVLSGAPAIREFAVSSADGSLVRVAVERDALPTGVEVELAPVEPDAEGRSSTWQGSVRLDGAADPGVLQWPVRLVSDRQSAGRPTGGAGGAVSLGGSVTVAAEIVAPVDFAPPHLSLGVLRAGAMRAERAVLRIHDTAIAADKLAVVVDAEFAGQPAAEWVRARLVPHATQPDTYELELVVDGLPEGVAGRLSGRVLVGLPEGPPIAVLGFAGVGHGR